MVEDPVLALSVAVEGPALAAVEGALARLDPGKVDLASFAVAQGEEPIVLGDPLLEAVRPPGPEGRVFVVDGRQLLVPYSEGHLAIALLLSPGNDLVVMCRR